MSIEKITALRRAGQHEQAQLLAVELARAPKASALLLYETACVHDYLGLEAQAVPYYLQAMQKGLPPEASRGAYLGLGSTYRTLGQYTESLAIFAEGIQRFPLAQELKVFHAMTLYNLGQGKQAVQSLLGVIADNTDHEHLQMYGKAIKLYAQDLDRVWA
jgi:tetratricopeptide (TPR) repeat protein